MEEVKYWLNLNLCWKSKRLIPATNRKKVSFIFLYLTSADISNEGIGIKIAAAPVDGEANSELIKFISKLFGIRKSDINLDKVSICLPFKAYMNDLTEKLFELCSCITLLCIIFL